MNEKEARAFHLCVVLIVSSGVSSVRMFFSNPPFLFIGCCCSMTLPLESEWWLPSGKVTEQRSARDADCSCHCLFVCSFGLSPIINTLLIALFPVLHSPHSPPQLESVPSLLTAVSVRPSHEMRAVCWVGWSVGRLVHLILSHPPFPLPHSLFTYPFLCPFTSRCLPSHIVTFSFTYIRSEKSSSIISLSIFIFNYFFFLYDMARKSLF